MRRLLTILLIALPSLAMASDPDIDLIFKRYEGVNGYQSIVYGRKMLDIMGEKSSPEVKRLLKGIRVIRIISSKDSTGLYEDAAEIAKREYGLMSTMTEDSSTSSFYIREEKDISTFLMIAKGPSGETVLEIRGKFDVKDISKLSSLGINTGKRKK